MINKELKRLKSVSHQYVHFFSLVHIRETVDRHDTLLNHTWFVWSQRSGAASDSSSLLKLADH